MEISGRPHEGWMSFVPLTVLILFIVVALGGPVAFVNTLSLWVTDLASYVVGWIKSI